MPGRELDVGSKFLEIKAGKNVLMDGSRGVTERKILECGRRYVYNKNVPGCAHE